MVSPANAFDFRLRGGTTWFKSDKISKTPFGLADRNRLSLFLHVSFSSSLRTFFLSQNKMECLFFSAVWEGCDVVFASLMDPWIWSGE